MANAGTRDEPQELRGISKILQIMELRTTVDRNAMQSRKMIQWMGGEAFRSQDQERTFWKGNCMQEHANAMTAIFCDALVERKDTTSILEAQTKMRMQLSHTKDVDERFNEIIVQTAQGGEGLGGPLLGHESNIEDLCEEQLDLWQEVMYSPKKMVVAGLGVRDHAEFVDTVEKHLGDRLNPDDTKGLGESRRSNYIGGESRHHDPEASKSTVFVGFKSPGQSMEQLAAVTVTQVLLGNGEFFTTGGPGKGMHARLTQNVLGKASFINAAACEHLPFSCCGVFGITAHTLTNQGEHALEVVSDEMRRLMDPIPPEELDRAKNMAKILVSQNLERSSDRLEEACKQLLLQDEVTWMNYMELLEEVDSEKIGNLAASMLASNPTVIMNGNVASIPSFDKISGYFNKVADADPRISAKRQMQID